MPTGKVTKRSVDSLQPTAQTQFLWDEEVRGFGLRITSSGSRAYVYQYRLGGREAKTQRYTIGKHGAWTPDAARIEAKRLAQLVDKGINPADADRERRRQAVDLAFSAYVDTFVKGYLQNRWKRWEAAEAMLVRDAVPVLRDKPLPLITRADLNAVQDRLQGRAATGRLMHATLRKLFRWAIGRGDIERSPLEGAEAPPAVKARERVLSDNELALVWCAAAEVGAPFAELYRLLILTGQRREEVAGMAWSELNRALALWTLPGDRAKNGETHLVPLSGEAVASLDCVAGDTIWPNSGLVFSTTGKTAVSGFSRAKRRIDKKMVELEAKRAAEARRIPIGIAPWRVHDLRRTLATGLQRLGVRFEVTEAVLNHRSGSRSGIAGVYQRHDWAVEKRDALEAWAKHVRAVL